MTRRVRSAGRRRWRKYLNLPLLSRVSERGTFKRRSRTHHGTTKRIRIRISLKATQMLVLAKTKKKWLKRDSTHSSLRQVLKRP